MDFAVTSEEKALVDALRQNLKRACPPERLRAWEFQGISMDADFVRTLAEGAFLEAGLPFGMCPSFTALTLMEEGAGRFLAPPLLSWLPGYAVHLLGEHELARKVVEGAIVSPTTPDISQLIIDGGRLRGSGSAQFLDRASLIFGLACNGAETSLTVVPKDAPGVTVETASLQSGTPCWHVTFDRAEPAELLTVPQDRVTQAMNRLRTGLAAWSVGAGSQAIDLAVAYASERKQFDHPIGSYQSVQNRLVDAAVQIEEARMLAYRAATLVEAGSSGEATDIALLARHLAGKAFTQASRAATMTFGGYGFTVDFDVQLYFRRAKETQLTFEPRTEWHDKSLVPGFRNETR